MATYTAPRADLAKTVPGDREGEWQGVPLERGEPLIQGHPRHHIELGGKLDTGNLPERGRR